MSTETAQIQLRRDTAANWTSNNPTLAQGEIGFETDTGFFKIGNGSTGWTLLAYCVPSPAGAAAVSSTGATAGTVPVATGSNSYSWQPKLTFDARDYGVKANGVTRTDGIISGNQLSFTGTPAQPPVAGQLVVVVGAGTPQAIGTTNADLPNGTPAKSVSLASGLPAMLLPGGVQLSTASVGTISAGLLANGAHITSIPVNALANAISAGTITLVNGGFTQTFTTAGAAQSATSIPITSAAPIFSFPATTTTIVLSTQSFVTMGAAAGDTSIPVVGPQLSAVTVALTTGSPITSITVDPLNLAVAAGTINVIDPVFGNVQQFTTTGAAAGTNSIPVSSETPLFAFPQGSMICVNSLTFTPTVDFPVGSTLTGMTPALSTTAASVNAGVVTLNASAGTNITSNAEVFYATDDTVAAQACITAAGAAYGVAEFPNGQIGLSAALTSSTPLTIRGQHVSSNWVASFNMPTVAPWLQGTVFVQCAQNTDGITLSGAGVTQNIEKFGVRFAGRFQNTGHGVNYTGSWHTQGLEGATRDGVTVFGHDGNHYAFPSVNAECNVDKQLQWFGGGGVNFMSWDASPGNHLSLRQYGQTFVGGIAHGWAIQNIGNPGGNIDFCTWVQPQTYMAAPSSTPFTTNIVIPEGHAQFAHISLGPTHAIGIEGPDFEENGPFLSILYPNDGFGTNGGAGTSNYVTAYLIGQATLNTTMHSGALTTAPWQNRTGSPQRGDWSFIMNPAASSPNTTTVATSTAAGAITMTLTSATGFAAGQGVRIDSAAGPEFRIIQSVSGAVLTFNIACTFLHTSGDTVSNGHAVAHVTWGNTTQETGNIALGANNYRQIATSAGTLPEQKILPGVVPAGKFFRLDYSSAKLDTSCYDPFVQ